MRCSGPTTTMMGSTCNTTDGGRPALLLSSSVCNVIEYSTMAVGTVVKATSMANEKCCAAIHVVALISPNRNTTRYATDMLLLLRRQ